jgi:hypothetical protein
MSSQQDRLLRLIRTLEFIDKTVGIHFVHRHGFVAVDCKISVGEENYQSDPLHSHERIRFLEVVM